MEEKDQMVKADEDRRILANCIYLMDKLVDDFKDYMDYMNLETCDEDRFRDSIGYVTIVQTIFLRGTSHSGMTSAIEKCRELHVDPFHYVYFDTKEDGKEGRE